MLSVEIDNANITNTPVTVTATADTNDSLATLADRVAMAINGSVDLSNAGINASASGDVVTVLNDQVLSASVGDSVYPSVGAANSTVSYTLSVSGVQSETMTLGTYTGPTPSIGYTNSFPKPNDWMRTIRFWYSMEDGARPLWFDIDFRDEGNNFHANYFPAIVRYLSTDGMDSTKWPANFRDAVLAWLQYQAARNDATKAAVAAERFKFWEAQCDEAAQLDDMREVPKVRTGGRFLRGRYGRGTMDIEQALPPYVPL